MPLTLDIHPAGHSSCWLQEDDGMSPEYQRQVVAQTELTADLRPGALTIEVHAPTVPFHVDSRAVDRW
ncbi:MAG TPA: DUF5110 domain-containing protein [Vicinamibacterales bacterium]|jgi:hypothetical protein